MNIKREYNTWGIVAAALGGIAVYGFLRKRMNGIPKNLGNKKAVLITGCDTGLGYSFAKHLLEKGVTVLACVLNPAGTGATQLSTCGKNVHLYTLDVRDMKSINALAENVKETLQTKQYELQAVVNNAGVFVFGDFEWHTDSQITHLVDVNYLGPIRVTKALLPLLREHKGRLVNISSHCAKAALPSTSVYSSTKAAVESWSEALRIELERFQVKVISFKPGSYIHQSKIMSNQAHIMAEMENEMTEDVKSAYGHFKNFQSYMKQVANKTVKNADEKSFTTIDHQKNSKQLDGFSSNSNCTSVEVGLITDPVLMNKFDHAIFARNPGRNYSHGPPRYNYYYFLFDISFTHKMREFFIKKFVSLPQYK